MTLDEYQNEAKRTAPRSMDAYPAAVRTALAALHDCGSDPTETWARELLKTFDVLIWGQGLAGEAGEVCDLLKKVHGHGKPYDADKMLKELGDVLWYVANLADAHGFTLSEVAAANVDKLRARYKDGFSVAAAQAKADERCSVSRAEYDRQVEAAGAAAQPAPSPMSAAAKADENLCGSTWEGRTCNLPCHDDRATAHEYRNAKGKMVAIWWHDAGGVTRGRPPGGAK